MWHVWLKKAFLAAHVKTNAWNVLHGNEHVHQHEVLTTFRCIQTAQLMHKSYWLHLVWLTDVAPWYQQHWCKQHFSCKLTLVDTTQQLWKCIHDAANGVHTTPGVLKCVRALFTIMLARVHGHGRHFKYMLWTRAISKSFLSQAFCIPDMLNPL